MSEDYIVVNESTVQTVPSAVYARNQVAINIYRKELTPATSDNIPDGLNPDGTPIEGDK